MKYLNHYTLIIASLSIFIIFKSLHSQTVTVDGYTFLENQSEHDSIQIVFERIAPAQLFDTVYTDINGYFNKIIATGIYNVTFSKSGYLTTSYIDVNLYLNYTFPDNTLLQGNELSGQLSGIIHTGTYHVINNIEVANGTTLLIEPGVTLLFYEGVEFDINGLLVAEGNEIDSIKFTRYANSNYWNGIEFNNIADDNSVISFCIIEYSNSCGIKCNDSNPTLTNSAISNNTANQGGAIMCDNSNPSITNLTITDNSANYGGGICCSGSSCNPLIINSNISNNSANYDGGGIYCAYSTPTITNTIITENSAEFGGGIHIYSLANTTITNSNIHNNTADYGGGVWCGNASFILTNTIVTDNSNYGIYFDYGNHSLSYSNFWNNNPENFYNCDAWVGLNVTVNNNNDSIDAYGNMQFDPIFINSSIGDFHFLSTSPCIDAGVNDSVSIEYDFDGNIRIWDGNNDSIAIVDMGAYEFGSIQIATITSTFTCPDNICINDTALIVYSGNASDTAYYFWEFNEGIIISGIGPGPYEVLWSESGEKTISLIVEEDGMTSETTTKTLIVIPLPTVYAGQDTTIQNGESYTITDAEAENYESLIWSTSGDGIFNDIYILHPVYSPGQNDIINGNVSLTLTVNSSCGNESDDILLSIEQLSLSGSVYVGNNGFVLYPNPVANELNIKFDKNQENMTIELFTLSGQKVLSKQINNASQNFKINVSVLDSGIYVGKAQTSCQNYFFKILK